MRWGAVLIWPSWTNADCRRWTPSRAARAILSFQPVLERIQYLYFIIFWKKEWKLNRNIGSSKLNSPLSFFLFSLLSSFPFPFSFSLFFFCIIAPPAPKICRTHRRRPRTSSSRPDSPFEWNLARSGVLESLKAHLSIELRQYRWKTVISWFSWRWMFEANFVKNKSRTSLFQHVHAWCSPFQ